NAIAHYCATERFLDAEAEATQGQIVGAKKNGEVRTRAALSGAVDGVELAAAHQARLTRKGQRRSLILERGYGVPSCGELRGPCGRPLFSCERGSRASWRGGVCAVDMCALAKQFSL